MEEPLFRYKTGDFLFTLTLVNHHNHTFSARMVVHNEIKIFTPNWLPQKKAEYQILRQTQADVVQKLRAQVTMRFGKMESAEGANGSYQPPEPTVSS